MLNHGSAPPLPDVSTEKVITTPAPMPDEPVTDVTPLQALLQYHILPFPLRPADIQDGMLIGTERRTPALKGGRERLRVDVSDRLDPSDWDNIGQGEIRFGGSTVLGKPSKLLPLSCGSSADSPQSKAGTLLFTSFRVSLHHPMTPSRSLSPTCSCPHS